MISYLSINTPCFENRLVPCRILIKDNKQLDISVTFEQSGGDVLISKPLQSV